MKEVRVPVVVVGSGIAGLTFSLKVADAADVLLVTKKDRAESNTNWARGGIAAVVGPDDDPALHVRDTLVAGAGLCHRDVVESVVREGPDRIRDLVEWGARFQRKDGHFSLGKEGGHSRRRIVHAGDRTGSTIERALLHAVAERPEIRVEEDLMVVDLLTREGPDGPACAGILAIQRHSGEAVRIHADAVLLATGGCGQVYRHTTNPGIATGDGVAMAYRAGARVANMEFIQFHPTALFPTEDPAFLISEAVRGEGGVLRTRDGEAFMDGLHPQGSLAPRDVVARGIHRVLRATGDDHVVLDVSAMTTEEFRTRFPSAMEGCVARGVDPVTEGIPVVPAAHYQCGGIWTDGEGATSLPGLFATGEVACTGLHGANRLASNSLLEALVYSQRASSAVAERVESGGRREGRGRVQGLDLPASSPGAPDAPPEPAVENARRSLRARVWEHAGIERTVEELTEARDALLREIPPAESDFRDAPTWTTAAVELRNLRWVAYLVVESALRRRESRGLHFLVDAPWRNNEVFLRDTVLVRDPETGP